MNEARMTGPEIYPDYRPPAPTPEELASVDEARAIVAERLGITSSEVSDGELLRYFQELGFQMLAPKAAESVRLALTRLGLTDI